jgi:hypothetical protein
MRTPSIWISPSRAKQCCTSVPGPIATLEFNSCLASDLNFLFDFYVRGPGVRVLVLRSVVDRPSPTNRNAPCVLSIDQRRHAGWPIRGILAQRDRGARFDKQLDIVFQPEGTGDILPRRDIGGPTSPCRACVNCAVNPTSCRHFDRTASFDACIRVVSRAKCLDCVDQ